MFLSCHVRIWEWIHTLQLPECQGYTPRECTNWKIYFMCHWGFNSCTWKAATGTQSAKRLFWDVFSPRYVRGFQKYSLSLGSELQLKQRSQNNLAKLGILIKIYLYKVKKIRDTKLFLCDIFLLPGKMIPFFLSLTNWLVAFYSGVLYRTNWIS